MNSLSLAVLALLAATTPPDAGAPTKAVSADGGDVPILAPGLTPAVAKVLAPELVSDGGVERDGGATPILAPQTLSVYRVNLPAETALTAGFFGLYVMVDVLVKPTLGAGPNCLGYAHSGQCDPSTLSAFDRYAVGRVSPGWATFSDVALVVSLAAPLLYLGLESLTLPTKDPLGDFIGDSLVVAESLALTATVQTVLKFAFRRPRPANYLPGQGAEDIDLQLSFPSGHVSMVAAATTALTTTIFLRHPKSKVRFLALGAGISLSLLTGLARVESGQHFPTDVLTGLVVGACSGFVVPFLHRKQARVQPSVTYNPVTQSTMLSIAGTL